MNVTRLNKHIERFLDWLGNQADPDEIEGLFARHEAAHINKELNRVVEDLENALYYINQ